MFANPNHPTVEYHYRPDGTRPYSHCEDRDLFRVINVQGDCVYYGRFSATSTPRGRTRAC